MTEEGPKQGNSSIVDRFALQLARQQIPPELPLLVAVSGGADSVALLRLVCASQPGRNGRLVVGHVNHQLRGAASDADAAFVLTLGQQLQLKGQPVEVRQTRLSLRDAQAGLENRARHARYTWLSELAAQEAIPVVLTAHHADDQAETVLHHLIRGTGLPGLRGIAPERQLGPNLRLVRPLLPFTRVELRDYLAGLHQPFRHDASNDSLRFTRNRLRQELLPQLARYNPAIATALVRLADQAGATQGLAEQRVQRLLRQVQAPTQGARIELDRRRLMQLKRPIIRAVVQQLWLVQQWPRGRMSYVHWERLADLVLGLGDRVLTLPGGVYAGRTKRSIWFQPRVDCESNGEFHA